MATTQAETAFTRADTTLARSARRARAFPLLLLALLLVLPIGNVPAWGATAALSRGPGARASVFTHHAARSAAFQTGASVVFSPAMNYSVGIQPRFVTTGDLNGDGKLDLIVTNSGDNTVSVLLGHGDGTFGPATNTLVDTAPFAVATGDFNGDGKLDLAIANSGDNTVSVLLGNGDGTFRSVMSYATGPYPLGVAVGDFNGDGKPDIVVANFGTPQTPSNSVSVLLNNGDGTFKPAVSYPAGGASGAVAVGDLNGDGKLDLAVASNASNTVSVLLGYGDGTFRPAANYPVGVNPDNVAIGDLNGDGKPDLAVTNDASASLSLLFNTGNGTFGPAITYATGTRPQGVAIGDLNGDGKPDLAVANHVDNTVSVYPGNGDGTFGPPTSFATGASPNIVAEGDFNGDGKPDIAVADADGNSVSVLLNGTGASLTTNPPSGAPFRTIAVGGTGFGASEPVRVYWDSTSTMPLVTATTTAGAFVATVRVPQASAGPHTLIAVGQTSALSATAPFLVTPAVYLFPASGKAGSVAYMVGVGFRAGEAVDALWYPGFNPLGGATSNALGTAVVPFVVPASAQGTYYVIGYGLSSKVYAFAPFTVTALSALPRDGAHHPASGPPPRPPYPLKGG